MTGSVKCMCSMLLSVYKIYLISVVVSKCIPCSSSPTVSIAGGFGEAISPKIFSVLRRRTDF